MKKRAIQIIKNLTSTIESLENKKNVILLAREDMFATPTVSQFKLKSIKEDLINRYHLKEKEWSK